MNYCPKCKQSKPAADFLKDMRRKSRLSLSCKDCLNKKASSSARLKRHKKNARAREKRARTPKNAKKRPMRKTRLKPMSDDKRDWTALYLEKIDRDTLYGVYHDLGEKDGVPVVVRKVGSRLGCERHHVFRRWNWAILLYRFVTVELHRFIEDSSAKARVMGTLFNLEQGELRNPSPHDPLEALSELRELQSKY